MSSIENNDRWTMNHHEILDGAAHILQTKASNGVWQFRCYVSEEGKYVRKSLRTRDKGTALLRARDEYLQIHSDIKSGRKIFSMTLRELVNAYLEHREKHVEKGVITAGRLRTIDSQLRHFLRYKGAPTKLSELERKSAFEYRDFRLKDEAQDITIRNEQSTINALIRWAFENGHCSLPKLEFDVMPRITEAGRRDVFTPDEYDALTRFMRSWSSKKHNPDERVRMEKLLVRDFVLILSNTFMRIGEARQLKWGDVRVKDHEYDAERRTALAHIGIRAVTSKNRKRRDIITRGGQYFRRLKERTPYRSNDDFVFSSLDASEQFDKTKLYRYWEELMVGIGVDHKSRKLSFYSLRHFGITMRLAAGVTVWNMSKIAGTGVAFIENHYGHAMDEMMKSAALQQYEDAKNPDFGLLLEKEG